MLVVVGDGFTRFEVGVNKASRCADGREKDNAVLLLVTVCDAVHVRRIHHVMRRHQAQRTYSIQTSGWLIHLLQSSLNASFMDSNKYVRTFGVPPVCCLKSICWLIKSVSIYSKFRLPLFLSTSGHFTNYLPYKQIVRNTKATTSDFSHQRFPSPSAMDSKKYVSCLLP